MSEPKTVSCCPDCGFIGGGHFTRCLVPEIESLQSQLAAEKEAREKEKTSRIKYQNCAYSACILLDLMLSRSVRENTGVTIDIFHDAIESAKIEFGNLRTAKETAEARVKELEAEINRLKNHYIPHIFPECEE